MRFSVLCFLLQVVLGKSVAEVAQNVIKHVRLSLLTPEELKQVEQENEKDKMIPVSARFLIWFTVVSLQVVSLHHKVDSLQPTFLLNRLEIHH